MRVCLLFCLVLGAFPGASAQLRPYAGAVGGIATVSADGGSLLTSQGLTLSSYTPRNGAALNLFGGLHLHDYFSVQANFIWNRNDLRLNSAGSDGSFYQEDRSSSQKAVVFDLLVYFRRRSSRIRPYLGVGTGVSHLSSSHERLIASAGSTALPPEHFSSTSAVLRSHVGIDLRVTRKVDFRYSFSDLIGRNEISKHLAPAGPRVMENFHNLFGFVVRF